MKLIESSSIGSIQSQTGQPCTIFQEDKYLNDYKRLIKEAIEVAQSESVNTEPTLPNQLLDKLMNYPVSKGSSMLTDRLNGNMLELDAKIGAIVKIAKNNNIKVPISAYYYNLLLHYNNVLINKAVSKNNNP